jgi:hypothetical protein
MGEVMVVLMGVSTRVGGGGGVGVGGGGLGKRGSGMQKVVQFL